ncbi:hypothetical protein H8876_07275 [Clostridiales Family XIII bacterium BX16]|uniref:Gram-positive cocci surface proteins LPxTG domain-containing protein n=1 Tax=Lentihominibacter faecis TaxID=2764712 RepID=A0A923SM00_9FIRM|nr:carbohydrate-binding domain-containing protein [Lentihominibacter faecis]MBC5999799.1 hypothetical protein [Lentihominibacter faecis]
MEKSTIKRKIGVCFMALAMIVAMIPSWSVTANAATDYGLKVGGAEVTSDRTSGDGWSYNPTANTLTLNDYSYSGKGGGDGTFSGGIYSTSNLTIKLIGNNFVDDTLSDKYAYSCGIFVNGKLTITGDGSLTTSGGSGVDGKGSYGIMAGGLTVNNGTITAIGKTAKESYGIGTIGQSKNIIVNGGTITATGAVSTVYGSCGIQCSGNFTMTGGRVTAKSEGVKQPGSQSCGISSGASIYYNAGVLVAEGQTKAMYSSQSTYPNGYTKGDKTFRTYDIAESNMYTVSGVNSNGWANREAKLTATSGYKIGMTDKQFGSSISFTDEAANGSGVFYIKKTSNGTIYKGTISYNLDKTAPTISGATDGGIYCVSKSITVNDSHLKEVKDGNTVLGASNGTYTLPAGTHNITATDLAGNSTSITVTVNEEHDPNKDDGNCATAVTCKVCGDVVTPAKSHNYVWTSDPEGHWMKCRNAGCTSKTTLQRHVPGAAATEDKAQTCTVCGYTINPPLGHVCQNHLQKVNATTATCTQDGNNEYYKCTCGKIYSDTGAQNEKSESDFTIPATGHSYGTPAYTWSQDNLSCTAVRACGTCNAQETETGTAVTTVTPKDGCKTSETTLYTVTFTNDVFGVQTKEVVTKEADAHTPSEWIVDKKATTTEAGSRHQECTECGTVLKTETIAKLTDSKANINPSGKNDADKNAGEKSASSVPGTGDTSLVDVWALLMAFAVLGGVYALCRQRKAR